MSDTRTSTRAAQPSAGAMRAARALWEAGWFPREISLAGACEIIDCETGASELAGLLNAIDEFLSEIDDVDAVGLRLGIDNFRKGHK